MTKSSAKQDAFAYSLAERLGIGSANQMMKMAQLCGAKTFRDANSDQVATMIATYKRMLTDSEYRAKIERRLA